MKMDAKMIAAELSVHFMVKIQMTDWRYEEKFELTHTFE